MNKGAIPLTLVVVLAASGCSAETTPLELEHEPLWTSKDLGLEGVDTAELRGDRVVVQEPFHDRLVTVETESGDVIWSVQSEQELLGGSGEVLAEPTHGFEAPNAELVISGGDEDFDVIVPYRTDPEDEETQRHGIAALSGDDGGVVWTKEMGAVDEDADREMPGRAVLATPDVVLVRPWADSTGPNEPVTALDANSGEELWERDLDGWPYYAEEDIIVTVSEEHPDDAEFSSQWGGGNAVAWDVRTGERLWDLSEEWTDPDIVAIVNETALVSLKGGKSRRSTLIAVDTGSGEKVADLGDSDDHDCSTDGERMVVCHDFDGMTIIDTRGHSAVAVNFADTFDLEADVQAVGIHRDGVFVQVIQDEETQVHIVDSHGDLIARDAPGYPDTITEDFALFFSETGLSSDSTLALYQVMS